MVIKLPKPTLPDAISAALALSMIRDAGRCWGELKIQKVAFWVEYRLFAEGLAGPTFAFSRYTYGPYSSDLSSTVRYLVSEGFLDGGKPANVTKRGAFVADLCRDGLADEPRNAHILKKIAATLRYCAPKNGTELKNEAYALEWQWDGKVVTTADLPDGVELVRPERSDLVVPEWLAETLCEEFALSSEEIEKASRASVRLMAGANSRLGEFVAN